MSMNPQMYGYPFYRGNGGLRQDTSMSPYAGRGALSTGPWPSVGNETIDKLKAWMDKSTFPSSAPDSILAKVQNKHVALAGGAALILGLAYKYRRSLFGSPSYY